MLADCWRQLYASALTGNLVLAHQHTNLASCEPRDSSRSEADYARARAHRAASFCAPNLGVDSQSLIVS